MILTALDGVQAFARVCVYIQCRRHGSTRLLFTIGRIYRTNFRLMIV